MSIDNKNHAVTDQPFQGRPIGELTLDHLRGHYQLTDPITPTRLTKSFRLGGERNQQTLELPIYDMPSLVGHAEMLDKTGINGELKALLMVGQSGEDPIRYAVIAQGRRAATHSEDLPLWFSKTEGNHLTSPNRVHLVPMVQDEHGQLHTLVSGDGRGLISKGLSAAPTEIGREAEVVAQRDFPTSDLMSARHAEVSFDLTSGRLTYADLGSTNGTTFTVASGGELLTDGRRQENGSRIGHLALAY